MVNTSQNREKNPEKTRGGKTRGNRVQTIFGLISAAITFLLSNVWSVVGTVESCVVEFKKSDKMERKNPKKNQKNTLCVFQVKNNKIQHFLLQAVYNFFPFPLYIFRLSTLNKLFYYNKLRSNLFYKPIEKRVKIVCSR